MSRVVTLRWRDDDGVVITYDRDLSLLSLAELIKKMNELAELPNSEEE